MEKSFCQKNIESYPNQTDFCAPRCRRAGGRVLKDFKGRLGLTDKYLACPSRLRPIRCPLEQRDAHLILKISDPSAGNGWIEPRGVHRLPKASEVCRFNEQVNIAKKGVKAISNHCAVDIRL